jgi:hypothetical protein
MTTRTLDPRCVKARRMDAAVTLEGVIGALERELKVAAAEGDIGVCDEIHASVADIGRVLELITVDC